VSIGASTRALHALASRVPLRRAGLGLAIGFALLSLALGWSSLHIEGAGCSRSARVALTSNGMTWEVIDGVWRKDGDALVGSGGTIETSAEYGDATIELDAEQVADSGERNVGIWFRCAFADYDPRKTNGYEVDWTARNRMNEFVNAASVSKPLHRAWLSVRALRPLKNHVVVRAYGGTFIVEVNGVEVDRFSDDTFRRGHVRLWVESRAQSVRFEHVWITPT
jgi:hypothetical protein